VIIPTYNRAGLVLESIESVFAQSFTNFEIVVIDDGSTDQTRNVLEPLVRTNRIRYVFRKNGGESAARNTGIGVSHGTYILFLDSDDLLMPQTLEKLAACLDEHPEVGLVHGSYNKVDACGRDLGYRDTSNLTGPTYPEILLQWSVMMAVPTVMVRKSMLDTVGGFDETMEIAPDLDMWRRIARRTAFRALPETLAKIRTHDGNKSRDKTRATAGFEIYLQKAFQDDPSLGVACRHKALAAMYASVGMSMVGGGERHHMSLVRQCCWRSLMAWPFQGQAFLGIVGSFLGAGLRGRIVARWRQHKFPQHANRRPRLLLLGSQMARAGAQHVLLAQADWFRNNGYHVVVAFFHDREGIRTEWQDRHAIDIIDLKAWRTGAPAAGNIVRLVGGLWRLFRLIVRERITVAEAFTHESNLLGLPIAWIARVPVRVGTHHCPPTMRPALRKVHSWLANAGVMTHFVAVAEHFREMATAAEGINPAKVSVIANGISHPDSSGYGDLSPDQIRAALGLPKLGRLVLSVGRLSPEKGHIHLIEAMPVVLQHFPDTQVAIAGDGPLRDSLQRRVDGLQLTDHVRLLGTRLDVDRLLAAADLFAHPSIRDGGPLVLMEALAMRVPIICSAFDGVTGILEHGKTALLVPAGDANAFAAALLDALDAPAKMQDLADHGANVAANRFSVQTMCERYDRLFRHGLGRRSP